VLLLTVIAAVLVYVFVHVLLFVDHHCAVQLYHKVVGAGAAGNVHSVAQLYIVTSLVACRSLNEFE
jgi:hypothetical protein